ncbi:MAG: alpha/beta hydrolase [Chromatiaceae bacterium]|nr:alpha/beta hydrolase [Chromatiaceae bacterium]MCF7996538.1 alpha/beta hydrolase [Chromatiaceae bacterium]MCF8017326.1 alpha/beta hydrolase [Chromatiaceae bacterium]
MPSNAPPLDQLELAVTASGRRVAFSQLGDREGAPIIYAHGFPSSRREAWLVHTAACAVGARIISIDRPGYGDSDQAPDRNISDWPDDVLLIADQLGLERFALLGVSGGGPYVLACAWRLGQSLAQPESQDRKGRITSCALVCPLGPIYRDEQLEQMHWAARMNLRIGQQAQWLGDLVFGGPTTMLLEHWPSLVENTRSLAAPASDRAVLADPETAAILNRTIADAMRNGAPGARRDLHLYTHDWGIPFQQIDLPIRIWHGQADGTVPIEHARWYAKQLPNASLTELPGEGHYSVPFRHSRQILSELIKPAS